MSVDLASVVDEAVADIDGATPDIRIHAGTYVDAIQVKSIRADPTYQRDLNASRVAAMAAEFDPSLVGVIEVSLRAEGLYFVIDGQHRLEAVRLAKGRSAAVACNVHTGLTPEEEARLFFDIDRKRVRLTGWARWNARRGAGEQIVLDIEALAAKHGLAVVPAAKPNSLRCTAACEKIVALSGLPLLDEALQVILEAWPAEMDALRGEIVHGIALVLAYYPASELDRDRLVSGLRRLVARQVTARAAALRETQSGQMPRLVARIVVDLYNSEPGPKAVVFAKRVPSQSKSTLARP